MGFIGLVFIRIHNMERGREITIYDWHYSGQLRTIIIVLVAKDYQKHAQMFVNQNKQCILATKVCIRYGQTFPNNRKIGQAELLF